MLLHVEPAPSTVTLPSESPPPYAPMKPSTFETAPPLRTLSTPTPNSPTYRSPLLVKVEPAPSTVAVPVPTYPVPLLEPRKARVLETVPPLVILRLPWPQ